MAKQWTESVPLAYRILDAVIFTYFAIELAMKLAAYRWRFFWGTTLGNDWRWNFFDGLTVVLQLIEEVVESTCTRASAGGALLALRFLRVFRLLRLFRFLRVVSAFPELRMLCVSIVASMTSLLWIMIFLFATTYMFAVLITQSVTHVKIDGSTHPQEASSLFEFFGTLNATMYSLYVVVADGIHWYEVVEPLWESCHPLLPLAFCAYMGFNIFAMLNVITGIFVETAIQTAKDDRKEVLLKEIRNTFDEVDTDHSGTITLDEFQAQLGRADMRKFLADVELGAAEALDLFSLLDVGNDGAISPEAFVKGCMRLQGNAKAIDVAMFMDTQTRVLECFQERLEEHFNFLADSVVWLCENTMVRAGVRPAKSDIHL